MKKDSQKKYLVLSCVFLAVIVIVTLAAVNGAVQDWNQKVTRDALETVLESGDDPERLLDKDAPADAARTTVRSPYVVLKTTNYFTALARGQEVESVSLAGSVQISEEDALALAQAAAGRQQESGDIGGFAYLRQNLEDGTAKYAFVDISQQAMQQISLGVASVGWGAVAIALLIGYVAYVALTILRPLRARCTEGAKLLEAYAEEVRKVEKGSPNLPELAGISDGLGAGALALDSPAKSTFLSLTDFAQVAARRYQSQIEQRGGRVVESLQPHVYVKAKAGLLEALSMLLLSGALTQMREGASVHVDVLSDGRQAALMVRYAIATDGEPKGDLLGAAYVLARGMGGSASFDVPKDGTACYTVRLRNAVPRS